MKTVTQYQCEVCHRLYDNEALATRCESNIDIPKFQVGDIVTARAGFGWYDGDLAWIGNPDADTQRIRNSHGNCFGDCCTYSFYYVITSIDRSPEQLHRMRYHLETLAMSGKMGYRRGYTFNSGHCSIVKVQAPPSIVIEQSKGLIGHQATGLL